MNEYLLQRPSRSKMNLFQIFMGASLLSTFVVSDLDRWSPINIGGEVSKISMKNTNILWTITRKNEALEMANVLFSIRQTNVFDIAFNEEGDMWMIKKSDRSLVYLSHDGVNKYINSEVTAVATGRKDLLMVLSPGYSYIRIGINASMPEGQHWQRTSTGIIKISCARDVCFGVDSTGQLFTTGFLSNPVTNHAWEKIGSNTKRISAYGQDTLWKLDSNGYAWEATSSFDRNFTKLSWERRGFESTQFGDIAVSNKMAFAFPIQNKPLTLDSGIRVRTGCPIFNFEDQDSSDWNVGTGGIFTMGLMDGNLPGLEGNYALTSNNGDSGVTYSPVFQVRHDMLHFSIGGGAAKTNYVALVVNGIEVRTASGHARYKSSGAGGRVYMTRWWWDVKEYTHHCAKIKFVDKRTSSWGSTAFDDLRTSPPCFKGMEAALTGATETLHIGQIFSTSVTLKGFFVSKRRPLVVTFSFPKINGSSLGRFNTYYVEALPCNSTLETWTSKESSGGYDKYIVSFTKLLEDATLRLEAVIKDNPVFSYPASPEMNWTMGITVNYTDEFVKRLKYQLTAKRFGNDVAKLELKTDPNMELLFIGQIYEISLKVRHDVGKSSYTAYNITLNIYAPPQATLKKAAGLLSSDVLQNTFSQCVIKIAELKVLEERSLSLQFEINDAVRRNRPRLIEERIFMDVTYCLRPNCMDIHNKEKQVIWLKRNAVFHVRYMSKKKPAAAATMEVFTAIVTGTESLIFICGPYAQRTGKHCRNCYYSNSTTNSWQALHAMVSNLTYYDAGKNLLYGTNDKGLTMKIYGDAFKTYYFLDDDELKMLTESSDSYTKPIYVRGDPSQLQPINSPNITLSGRNGFQYTVNSYGGSSRASSLDELVTRNKWLCCP